MSFHSDKTIQTGTDESKPHKHIQNKEVHKHKYIQIEICKLTKYKTKASTNDYFLIFDKSVNDSFD